MSSSAPACVRQRMRLLLAGTLALTWQAVRIMATQVWVEVQHCEERVQLLCTITSAMETHVIILQDELCKVGLDRRTVLASDGLCPVYPSSPQPQRLTCFPVLQGRGPNSALAHVEAVSWCRRMQRRRR